MPIQNKYLNILTPFFIFALSLSIYIIFAGRLKFEFPTDKANYFSYLAYSLIHGRVDLINPNWDHDLTIWQDRQYLYWGPSPVVLILPFILFFGVNFSDVLYTAIIASFSPLIFYLTLEELNKLKIIVISNFRKFILSMFLAFGTVHFVLSVNGGVWFTSQAVSTFYIFAAIFFIFRFKRLNRLKDLIFSTILLNLSILGRISFIFYLPVFLLLYFGTGYLQFGYRYILDAIPLLLLLLGEIVQEIPLVVITSLLLLSVVINTLGTLWFLKIFP